MEKEAVTTREYIIDAEGKRLGRVATEAASILLGKDQVDVVRHLVTPVTVKIQNASKLDISEIREQETFQTETLGHLAHRRGYAEVVTRVISGMLPKNKLHKPRMKNLEVTE